MNSEPTNIDAGLPREYFPWHVVALTLVAVGVVLLATVWIPQRHQIKALKTDCMAIEEQIETTSKQRLGATLDASIQQMRATNALLRAELAYWISRRNSFADAGPIAQLKPPHDEGRIDFKVALFNARTNLLARAQAQNTMIPQSLGMDETISSDTRVETALAQLATTVRLVERIMQAQVPQIVHIQPLKPRMYGLQHAPYPRLREYPIEVELHCSFEQGLRVLTLLAQPESGFSLEHFDLSKLPLLEYDTELSLRMVATAGLPLRRRWYKSSDTRGQKSWGHRRTQSQKTPASETEGALTDTAATDATNQMQRENSP